MININTIGFKNDGYNDLLHLLQKMDYKEIHCKIENSLIKDSICCKWEVPKGQTQTVFQTAGFEQIFASGMINYDCGKAPFILVNLFIDDKKVGNEIEVFKDSCVAFNYTKFNKIQIACPTEDHQYWNSNCDCDNGRDCGGEIYITTRFPRV